MATQLLSSGPGSRSCSSSWLVAQSRKRHPGTRDDRPERPGTCRVQAPSDRWVTKICEYRHEREAAFRLVHAAYSRSGLSSTNPHQMRVIRHHLCEHTDIMITRRADQAMLTTTLVRDAGDGLPMEAVFAEEVGAMRAAGLRVAEISCLASAESLQDATQRFNQLVKIVGLTFQVARYRGIDRVLMAVHPRHAKVYQRLFGCLPCSQVREYAAVQGNPAIMCMHDFAMLDRTGYPLYKKIYGVQYHKWQLEGTRMTESEKWHFSQALPRPGDALQPVAFQPIAA